MNFGVNLKASLNKMPLSAMSNSEKFLSIAAHICSGREGQEFQVGEVIKIWPISIFKNKYHPRICSETAGKGWIDPARRGYYVITKDGMGYINKLVGQDNKINIDTKTIRKSGKLFVINQKASYSFDQFIRSLMAKVKKDILIADSYVNATVFTNFLESVPEEINIRLIYAKQDSFIDRAQRFKKQYKFDFRKINYLHDRFIIVDDIGYIIGPSLKDAAFKSPAIVVALDREESVLLRDFFDEMWNKSTSK